MPDESPLEKTANEEYEKAPEKAKQQARAPSASYFDRLGQSFIDTFKAVKNIAKFTFHTAKLGLGLGLGLLLTGGSADVLALSGGFMLGDILAKAKNKEKITYGKTTNRGVAGAIVGIPMHYLFGWVFRAGNYVGSVTGSKAAAAATKGVLNLSTYAPFVWTDERVMHLLDRQYPIHIGADFWKYSQVDLPFKKKLAFVTSPNAAFTPLKYQIPVGACVSALYSYLSAGKKEEKKEDTNQTPQQPYQQQMKKAA